MKTILSTAMLWCAASSVCADTIFQVQKGQRLGAVVEAVRSSLVNQKDESFWRGSYIRSKDDQFASAKAVLIDELVSNADAESGSLARYLGGLSDMRRHDYSLDYDAVRLDIQSNPVINKSVQLVVRNMPLHVLIVSGGEVIKKRFVANTQVTASVQDVVNTDWVYLISADGSYTKIGVRMFNKNNALVQKGSIIYSPLKSLSDEQNMRVVKLLANGVVK